MFITLDLTNISGQTKNRNHRAKNLLIDFAGLLFFRVDGRTLNLGVQTDNRTPKSTIIFKTFNAFI